MADSKLARRQSRMIAVQALFYHLERPEVEWKACLAYAKEAGEEKADDDFAEQVLQTCLEHLGKIKVMIRGFATQFAYDKIAPINRALLIAGIAEMKFIGTPPVVVINEYVEMAKMFGEERSAPFINGVLDNLRKNLGLGGSKKKGT